MPTPVYVAVGAQIGLGLDSGDGVNRNWVDLLREKMPEGTRLVLLGRRGVTLRELNQVEILAAVTASPEIVTLWSVVSDATKRVDLATYIKELHQALITLTRRTEAEIILLNLPDISLLTEGVSDDQRSLIRGGVAQWNRAVADEASKYGRRVRVVDLYPISEQLFGERTKSDKADQSAGGGGNKVLAEAVWDAMRRPVG
jgi:hypothetical protein